MFVRFEQVDCCMNKAADQRGDDAIKNLTKAILMKISGAILIGEVLAIDSAVSSWNDTVVEAIPIQLNRKIWILQTTINSVEFQYSTHLAPIGNVQWVEQQGTSNN